MYFCVLIMVTQHLLIPCHIIYVMITSNHIQSTPVAYSSRPLILINSLNRNTSSASIVDQPYISSPSLMLSCGSDLLYPVTYRPTKYTCCRTLLLSHSNISFYDND
nr:MAG TPA: hypothetical protein [Caudoviricetes sp.]